MAGSPWRRGDTKLQVNQGVEHEESATVPSAPGPGAGTFWVRSDAPNSPMFTDDDGTDYILNAGSQWQSVTSSTTGAAATNTIATPVSALADGDQTFVEVLIFGEDAADATNTYFRHQLITYYRDGGTTTLWTVEESGRDQRRGTFPTTLTANLTTSTNDVIVNADTTGIGGAVNIDWTVLYITKGTIQSGLATGGGGGGSGTVTTVDKRGASKTVTASASSGGGTAVGSLSLGINSGLTVYLKVTANGNTTNSDIEFWRDVGKTDQVYQALGKDAFTSPFADGTPWSFVTASDLTAGLLYYTITNNGANASTYDIEALFHGE